MTAPDWLLRVKVEPQAGRQVYVAWDAAGACLYVGCAGSAEWRMHAHRHSPKSAAWVCRAAYWTATEPLHHRLATILERCLIRRVHPRFNITSHPDHTNPNTLRRTLSRLSREQKRQMAAAYLSTTTVRKRRPQNSVRAKETAA